jgi:uncharacterized protein
MKYLLILVLALAVIWLWQGKRRAALADKARRQKAQQPAGTSGPLPATEIIACDVCGVHLPRTEALAGGRGNYCSEAHRRQAEG